MTVAYQGDYTNFSMDNMKMCAGLIVKLSNLVKTYVALSTAELSPFQALCFADHKRIFF